MVRAPLQLCLQPNRWEVGVDEAGRGPLFGRVYAAAVLFPQMEQHTEWSVFVQDSKRFTSFATLKKVAELIRQHAVAYAVVYRDEKVVDAMNILQATQEAMHEALQKVMVDVPSEPLHICVDGNYFRSYPGVAHTCVEGGDGKLLSIAAASVLAKEARDDYIGALCLEHPDLIEKYGLDRNKGYGTKRHVDGIREHGWSSWHRRSFHVKELLFKETEENKETKEKR